MKPWIENRSCLSRDAIELGFEESERETKPQQLTGFRRKSGVGTRCNRCFEPRSGGEEVKLLGQPRCRARPSSPRDFSGSGYRLDTAVGRGQTLLRKSLRRNRFKCCAGAQIVRLKKGEMPLATLEQAPVAEAA